MSNSQIFRRVLLGVVFTLVALRLLVMVDQTLGEYLEVAQDRFNTVYLSHNWFLLQLAKLPLIGEWVRTNFLFPVTLLLSTSDRSWWYRLVPHLHEVLTIRDRLRRCYDALRAMDDEQWVDHQRMYPYLSIYLVCVAVLPLTTGVCLLVTQALSLLMLNLPALKSWSGDRQGPEVPHAALDRHVHEPKASEEGSDDTTERAASTVVNNSTREPEASTDYTEGATVAEDLIQADDTTKLQQTCTEGDVIGGKREIEEKGTEKDNEDRNQGEEKTRSDAERNDEESEEKEEGTQNDVCDVSEETEEKCSEKNDEDRKEETVTTVEDTEAEQIRSDEERNDEVGEEKEMDVKYETEEEEKEETDEEGKVPEKDITEIDEVMEQKLLKIIEQNIEEVKIK